MVMTSEFESTFVYQLPKWQTGPGGTHSFARARLSATRRKTVQAMQWQGL
jgi:hypothetical protein